MSERSTVVPYCGAVADLEVGTVGGKRDGTAPLCASIRSESYVPPSIADRIGCGGELALTGLAALDPHDVTILAALGC